MTAHHDCDACANEDWSGKFLRHPHCEECRVTASPSPYIINPDDLNDYLTNRGGTA